MASHKIQKPNGAVADELELTVAQALVDLESSIPELKSLYISSAKEVIIQTSNDSVESKLNSN
jgi:small subunit ribosomal protein S7e